MSKNLTFQHIGLASATFTVLLSATLFIMPNKVQAQEANSVASQSQPNKKPSIKKLGNRGLPAGRRRGGTSRNACSAPNTPLTALVPPETSKNLDRSNSFSATTTSNYPTFWVYVPQLSANLSSGEFVLQNDVGDDVYRTNVVLPSTPEVMGINLPPNPQYALKSGEKYQWYFKVYCGEAASEAAYFYVDAWMEKIAATPELKAKLDLKQGTTQEYFVYRDRQIWYDALDSLAKLLQANPQDHKLKAEWKELIGSIGLSDISNASFLKLGEVKQKK